MGFAVWKGKRRIVRQLRDSAKRIEHQSPDRPLPQEPLVVIVLGVDVDSVGSESFEERLHEFAVRANNRAGLEVLVTEQWLDGAVR